MVYLALVAMRSREYQIWSTRSDDPTHLDLIDT